MRPNPKPVRRRPRSRIFPIPECLLWLAVAALAAILPASAAAQKQSRHAPPPNPKAFVGTWTATFHGSTFMTLRFAMKSGKLAGTMSNGHINLDAGGNITSVEVRPGTKPAVIEKVEYNALYLSHGAADPLRLVFRLRDKTHGQLEFLNPPTGAITPKPIPLIKQTRKR